MIKTAWIVVRELVIAVAYAVAIGFACFAVMTFVVRVWGCIDGN